MLRRWLAGQFARPSGWAGRWWIGPWLNRLSGDMNRAAFEALGVNPGEHILELGFGGGDLIEMILGVDGAEVTGVDISQAMVSAAASRFRQPIAKGRAHVLLGAADRLPMADAAVDKACSVNALYFWADPAAVLSEFARVIRPDGRLVLCFQSPDQVRAWPGHRFGFHAYRPDAVEGWLADSGFGEIETKRGVDHRLGHFFCLVATRTCTIS